MMVVWHGKNAPRVGARMWTQILSTVVNQPETVRRGDLTYSSATDTLYVSDAGALRRVTTASGTPAATTLIASANIGPVCLDSTGRLFAFQEETTATPPALLRFDAPNTSATYTDVATDALRRSSPLATSLRVRSDGTMLVTGQGTGTEPA